MPLALLAPQPLVLEQPATDTVCYCVMAGQSNVLGFADLSQMIVQEDEALIRRYGGSPR